MSGTVVLGFDGSECAGSALDSAIDLARRFGDELVIVFAVEPPVRSVGEEFRDHEKALEEIGERVAGAAPQRAREAGVEAESRSSRNGPFRRSSTSRKSAART